MCYITRAAQVRGEVLAVSNLFAEASSAAAGAEWAVRCGANGGRLFYVSNRDFRHADNLLRELEQTPDVPAGALETLRAAREFARAAISEAVAAAKERRPEGGMVVSVPAVAAGK